MKQDINTVFTPARNERLQKQIEKHQSEWKHNAVCIPLNIGKK